MTKAFWIIVPAIFEASVSQPLGAVSGTAARSVSIPAAELHFYRDGAGFLIANAFGDPANGPHSNYIRMEGRSASPLHTHSASYYGVVISGTVANEQDPAAKPRRLPPGSYWYQAGREPHVTSCLSTEPCTFFVTAEGSFDFIPVTAPASKR